MSSSGYTSFSLIPILEPLSSEKEEELRQLFGDMEGIVGVRVVENAVQVEYYPQLLGPRDFHEKLLAAGCHEEDKKEKSPFKRWLNKMALSNQKTFGDAPLDCCTLNSKKKD